MFLLTFLVAFFVTEAHSFKKTPLSECTEVNLKPELRSETRNQGDLDWCYAFAVADLLGSRSQAGLTLSAADIALTYNTSSAASFMGFFRKLFGVYRDDPVGKELPYQTGFSKIAINMAYDEGVCPEEIFPSEKWTKHTLSPSGTYVTKVPLKEALKDILLLSKKRQQLTAENLPYFYSFKNIEDPHSFLELLKKHTYENFLLTLRDKACEQDKVTLTHQPKVRMAIKNGRIFKRLNRQLNQQKIILLDFDYQLLQEFSNHSLNLGELHTSLLIGRQWNTEREECEYLVRDSYGTSCDGIDPRARCDKGYVWLPEKLIYQNMTSFVYQE